jgi:ribosomal protein S18 acetylase RimI-like enzyme
MNLDRYSKLDNPAWWALNEAQQSWAVGKGPALRYRRGILSFAAYDQELTSTDQRPAADSAQATATLDSYLDAGEVFFLIGELPPLPASWTILNELPCTQMVLEEPLTAVAEDVPSAGITISHLTAADSADMYALVTKVQPGYYERGTHQLGNYYGIRQEGKLVAIAGERLRLNGLTEISAICTDPAYTGRGYAQLLTTHLCHTNQAKGITPFLHTLQTNERAIRIYQHLGFAQRRVISFWKLRKKQDRE